MNRTGFRATAAVSRALAVIAVLVSTALPAWAQEAAQTTRPDSTQAVSPRPIPPPDIPDRALRVGTALAAFRGQVSSDTAVRGIATALTDLTGRVRTATTDLGPVQLRGQSFENLADLEREWRGYERQVSEWQNRLGDRSAQLNAMQDSLRRMQASWRMTRDSTPRRDLPPELRQRIERVLLSVDSVQSRLRQPLGDLLALQDHAAQLQVQITDALSTIRTAQDTARRRLLEADYPPIWHLFVSDSTGPPSTGSLVAKLRPAKAYFDAHPQRLAYQGVFFVLLIAAMFDLRRRSVRWVTAEHLVQSPAQLFARPNAAAFLVTLATTRVFHPGAPQAVYSLAWILALPALLLLLPTAVGRDARRPAHVFAALFAIALLTDLLISHPLIGRLALLAVTALAGVGLVHLVRVTATRERARTSVWWRMARMAMWLGLGLLVGSLGANLLGYVALSRVVAVAVVNASFAAVVLVAFATVLIGMYVVFLETTVSRVLTVVQSNRRTLVRGGAAVIRLGLLLWWLVLVLQMLRIAQLVWHDVKVVFGYQAHIGTWSISLGEIFTFVVALWLGMTAARATRALLRDDVLTRIELPRGMPDAVSKLAYYVVAALGFLFAIGAAGIDLGKLTILVGALGIGIGFGLQTIVNNFISGLILLFERPIQIGDTIEVGGLMGNVQAIGIRASTVRTFDGAEVIVPNADLISTQVTNWTLSDRLRRIETPIGVAYGSDPANVLSILQGVAERNPKVLTNPTPMVLFVGFGDSSLNFALRAWTADFDTWLQVRSDLYTEIYDALAAAGIEIPFPQRDLHLRSVDAGAAGVLHGNSARNEPSGS